MHFSRGNERVLGALLWVASLQYFVVQLIVVAAWTVPYSWANHYISDLGNTDCGMYAGLAVCSPLHLLMNLSFVLYGVTIIGGSLLLRRVFVRSNSMLAAFWLMTLCGAGTILVGLFPENTIGWLHVTGAFFGLFVGNLAVVMTGLFARPLPRWLVWYSVVSGVVSLSAFMLFVSDVHLGIGRGGMERLISYPFTIWMALFGAHLLRARLPAGR